MNESSSGKIWWWIFGAIVIISSGVGAYIYASKGASRVAPVATSTGTPPKSSSTSTTAKPTTKDKSAITSAELELSATEVSSSLTGFDGNLSDLDSAETVEETPSL